MISSPFSKSVTPDGEALLRCLRREGSPNRVHPMEFSLDNEIQSMIIDRYNLMDGLDKNDPALEWKKKIKLHRFLGYDYVNAQVEKLYFPLNWISTEDLAENKKAGGKRGFIDESKGPVSTWEEFDKFPWPDFSIADTRALEWFNKNLPDDMILVGNQLGHMAEELTWLMGYETLCIALFEQRDLVKAIYDKVFELNSYKNNLLLQFDRIKVIFASDDLGFKTGPMFSPADMREFVFPAHKTWAKAAHDNGKLYFLHACGKLDLLIEDLIEEVKIDAKHSFEDTIEDVRETKARYGNRLTFIGGMDMDFLCRSDDESVRRRVRDTLASCQSGGGYCPGTGNTVANYIPLGNYLAMLDEGRRYN